MADAGVRSLRAERRAEELARRREDALAGAMAVFAEKGFYDAQMTEIAAAAELSRASLYSLFAGKEELYSEVIRSAAEQMRDEVVSRVESVSDHRERVLTLIDALFDCFEENRDLLRIVLWGTQGLPWRIHQNMGEPSRSVIHGFRDWAIKLCADASQASGLGVDPEVIALSLIGAVTNTAEHALDQNPERPLTRLAPSVREVFRRVLCPGEPA